MKASTHMARSMGLENLLGLMVVHSQAPLLTIILRDQVFMNGQMEEYLMEIGKTTRWMAMVHLLGQMAEDMSVSTLKI